MKFSPYSFSKMETWNGCPFKFKLNYVDKIRIPFSPNLALLRGSYFHHIIERNEKEFSTNSIFTQEEKEQCDVILNKFFNSELANRYLSQQGIFEERFAFNSKLEIVDYNDKTAWLRGAIDYHYVVDDTLYIIDWKSGKYKDPKYQSSSQSELYSIYGLLKYPNVEKIVTSYVYIEHLLENSFNFHRSDFPKLVKKFFDNTINIEQDEEFIKRPTILCDYCDFRDAGYCDGKATIDLKSSFGCW